MGAFHDKPAFHLMRRKPPRAISARGDLRGQIGQISADLRDNLFGRSVWMSLESATRTFLAAGEAVLRTRREDPIFDFSGPAVQFSKAVEVELNALIFDATSAQLSSGKDDERYVSIESRRIDLGDASQHETLGAMKRLLTNARVTGHLTREYGSNVGYLTEPNKLQLRLGQIQTYRNRAAHKDPVTVEEALKVRASVRMEP